VPTGRTLAGRYRVEISRWFKAVVCQTVVATDQTAATDSRWLPLTEAVVVTARRVEVAQEVPIPLSLSTEDRSRAGAFNVNRLKELIAVQFYSSNPRNSVINIRGLGAPFD
jgi:iron complex outermembrane receptor protein